MKTLLNVSVLLTCCGLAVEAQQAWTVHDRERPNPPVVTPADSAGGKPSDAKVLFDGQSLDAFERVLGGPAKWKVSDGVFSVVPGSGSIQTKEQFGDCQLHVEWASPSPVQGEDQMRGNSGLIMMGMFEIQVLDSYNARTYADGQAGAIYGQYPPLVNASRGPGQWQIYDILFRGPRFDEAGQLTRRTRVTLIHNGVVVQDATELSGPTAYHNRPPYFKVSERGPIVIQEHGTTVRYRNIWIRELAEEQEPLAARSFVALHPDAARFASYAGDYDGSGETLTVSSADGKVTGHLSSPTGRSSGDLDMIPMSDDTFIARQAPGADAVQVLFTRDAKSKVVSAVVFLGGKYVTFVKK